MNPTFRLPVPVPPCLISWVGSEPVRTASRQCAQYPAGGAVLFPMLILGHTPEWRHHTTTVLVVLTLPHPLPHVGAVLHLPNPLRGLTLFVAVPDVTIRVPGVQMTSFGLPFPSFRAFHTPRQPRTDTMTRAAALATARSTPIHRLPTTASHFH